ncbi:VCBS repeat-containing protein [Mycolicibacterium sp. BK634]|uniref:Ig-like domain-containing protein n=1 Tax=Mycolicibacterium sp. BK634 TaxID=2587099 RepID=UPI00161A35E5|nr:VCBS repeat-containing protein [Mycolicibacterium sp. BK634]
MSRQRVVPYQWLGAGAISLGIGAALAGGSGVAHAEAESGTGSAGPARSSAGDHSASSKPPRKNTPKASVAAVTRKPATARSARPSPRTPSPATPSAEVLATALAATTRRETGKTPVSTAVTNSTAELEREKAVADINMSVGWVPGVGTVINGMSLASDFLDFTLAALRGDTADMADEIRDMAIDVVGMVPIIGAPLAATIHRATAPVVPPPNHAPGAVNDSFTVDENAQLTGNVLTNDTDPDGDVLTAAVNTAPGHGVLTLNSNGSFTYTPASGFYGTDVFSYTVSDGKGGTAAGTATITVKSVDPAPVVDPQHPYSVDSTDPDTGKISGHFNVTDDDALTYHVVTAPDPTLGTFELDEQTGAWTFTPYPRTRVLASYFEPDSTAAVKLTFAVTATDGITTTAPVAVAEQIAASPRAALALPTGTVPVLSLVDPRTGDAYIFGYHGAFFEGFDEQTSSYLAVIVHSDGSYDIPTTGNQTVGVALTAFISNGTTYVVTRVGDTSDSYQTFVSELGPDGLTTVAGPLSGVFQRSIAVGDTTFVVTVSQDLDSSYQYHVTGLGPAGVTPTTSTPGFPYGDPIVVGDTTYLVSETGDDESGFQTHLTALRLDGSITTASIPGSFIRSIVAADATYLVSETGQYESGYQTHLTALGPDGVTSTTSIPGQFHEDSWGYSVVVGDTTYVVTLTGRYESGYETHVTALGPEGVGSTITIAGSTQHDPVIIGDTTYLLVTPYSRIVTHVLALTSDGTVPVGSIPGVLSGDPITVGGTTYLVSQTGASDDAETWQTYVTTLSPTPGGITFIGDPIAGYRYGHRPIVVGDTTYLVTETWNSTIGSETDLTAIGPDGLMSVVTDIPGRMWSDAYVVTIGGTTYLATTTSYYYPGDSTNTYEHTYLTGLGPDGPAPALDPVSGYPATAPIVVADTTYLVMEIDDPSTGYQVQLVSVTPDVLTAIGGPVAGRVNSHNDLDVIVIGGSTYLAVETSDHETSLVAVGSGGLTTGLGTLPGHLITTPIAVGTTTYLVTQTGEYESAQTYFTAVGPDGLPLSTSAVRGEVSSYEPIILAGDVTYVVTVEWEATDSGGYSSSTRHVTALMPDGSSASVDLPDGWGQTITVGDTTYFTTEVYPDDGGESQTHLVALTPDGFRTLAAPLTGYWFPPISLGDNVYLLSITGDPASGIESYQTPIVVLTPEGPVRIAEPVPGAVLGTSDAIFVVGDTRYIATTAGVWAIGVGEGDDSLNL